MPCERAEKKKHPWKIHNGTMHFYCRNMMQGIDSPHSSVQRRFKLQNPWHPPPDTFRTGRNFNLAFREKKRKKLPCSLIVTKTLAFTIHWFMTFIPSPPAITRNDRPQNWPSQSRRPQLHNNKWSAQSCSISFWKPWKMQAQTWVLMQPWIQQISAFLYAPALVETWQWYYCSLPAFSDCPTPQRVLHLQ